MRKNYLSFCMSLIFCAFASQASTQEAQNNGAMIYQDYCEACHQTNGEGIEDAYPALNGNQFVTGDSEELTYLLLEGRAGMPSFISDLNEAELTEIINYIRKSWSNDAEEVSKELVTKLFQELYFEDDGFGGGN